MATALLILHHETSTEISPELLSKLEKKARHKGVSVESLVEKGIEQFADSMIRGFYPSGDKE